MVSPSTTPLLLAASPRHALASENAHSYASLLPNVRVLHLGSTLCLCVQRSLVIREGVMVKAIPITVVAFGVNIRVDYDIPLDSIDTDTLGRMRVLFDVVEHSILVYVPGYFAHLLDLEDHHNPVPGVFLPPEGATPLPSQFFQLQQQQEQQQQQQTLPSTPLVSQQQQPQPQQQAMYPPAMVASFDFYDQRRHRFLDTTTGVVYKYEVDMDYLVRLVDCCQRPDHLFQLVHFMVVHACGERQDSPKGERALAMLGRLCARWPELVTAQLLKEFVVGRTFVALAHVLPRAVRDGVQATTTDQQEALLRKPAPVKHYRVVPAGAVDPRTPYELKRYWRVVEAPAPSFVQNHPTVHAGDRAVLNDIMRFFGGMSDADALTPALADAALAEHRRGVAEPDAATFYLLYQACAQLHPKAKPQTI